MIYRFTIISNEVEDFVAEILIDPYDTFLTLHEKMLELCGYENNQPTSFTVRSANMKSFQTITLFETDTAADEDAYVMEDTALNDFLEDEKQQLAYTFDPAARRRLYLELTEIITGKSMRGAKISKRHGTPPAQTIDEEEITNISSTTSTVIDDDEEDDMYGGVVSDEDINEEGLDISEGNPFDS